jgi:hypothetical protein
MTNTIIISVTDHMLIHVKVIFTTTFFPFCIIFIFNKHLSWSRPSTLWCYPNFHSWRNCPLVVLPGLHFWSFLLTWVTGHNYTKRHTKESLLFQTLYIFLLLLCHNNITVFSLWPGSISLARKVTLFLVY